MTVVGNPAPSLFTSSGEPVPMGRLPAHHARRDPRRPMFTQDGESISREAFDARTNKLARALAASGVKQGDFVTIALPNSIAFYETTFALWKLGAVPNPVSARLPDAEFQAIVDLVQPRLVVGGDPARLTGHAMRPTGTALDETLSAEPLPDAISPHWKAMTSGGSTGRPKVIVDHMPSEWDPNHTAMQMRVDDTLLNPGPLYHNGPFAFMHMGLFAGGHVVNMVRFDPLQTIEAVERHKVTWLYTVPTMMHRIWQLPEADKARVDLSSLHTVLHVAAACPVWLKERWIEWLGPEVIFEVYGGTERQGGTTITGTEWLAHKGSVGTPFPGTSVKIVGEDGNPAPTGEVGEIYFLPDGGKNSTYHYLGAEGKALGEWESIGDLGYLDADGYLYLVDRRTDLIISGGANIYPAEVEAALDAHPDVQSSVAIGLPDVDLGHKVHAIIQLRPEARGRIGADEMRTFVETRLVRYKVPRSFEFVEEALRDDAGKVRRSALRAERIAKA